MHLVYRLGSCCRISLKDQIACGWWKSESGSWTLLHTKHCGGWTKYFLPLTHRLGRLGFVPLFLLHSSLLQYVSLPEHLRICDWHNSSSLVFRAACCRAAAFLALLTFMFMYINPINNPSFFSGCIGRYCAGCSLRLWCSTVSFFLKVKCYTLVATLLGTRSWYLVGPPLAFRTTWMIVRHWFSKVVEALLRDCGPYWHDDITQLLQILYLTQKWKQWSEHS